MRFTIRDGKFTEWRQLEGEPRPTAPLFEPGARTGRAMAGPGRSCAVRRGPRPRPSASIRSIAPLVEPVVAAQLRLAGAPLLVGGLGRHRRYLGRRTLLVERDHRQVGGGRVRDLAGAHVLGLDPHAHLHRAAPGGVHGRLDREQVARRSTGCRNVIRSIAAVTTRRPEWRTAAIPATSSQRYMITPPCTLPAMFASAIPIQRLSSERDLEGGRGSTAASLGRANPSDV